MNDELLEQRFQKWWHDEGSGMPPQPDEDAAEHVERVCKIAWLNGAATALSLLHENTR